MCAMPVLSGFSISTYIYSALAIALLGLSIYTKVLKSDNVSLTKDNVELKADIATKISALEVCSSATKALKDRETELTKNAVIAVAEAKKRSIDEYKAANALNTRKPVVPVVTSDNAKFYGGQDNSIQLKDYLATQELINEFIDKRAKK